MTLFIRILALLLVAALPVRAGTDLEDLQPGRNFPAATSMFGGNHTENIDVGDVDNDGDLDVILANGGDFGDQPNRIYINAGGLQGGTEGVFTEETATRFAGSPDDTSRDIEFVDIDADGDLDVYVANRGSNTFGQPSRFYVNQGGLQGGTVGFFAEDSDARWGTLLSVPPADQVLGGNVGPFLDWSCDCEFGDLDNDGDQDLFHSSYGPSILGTVDSRVFLNDGTGVFNELWPWADPAADTKLHTIDSDLIDVDGDMDVDIMAGSRGSQPRLFMNNTVDPLPGAITVFSDVTQTALLDTGAGIGGIFNYEIESTDVDGDGDIDLWMLNYFAFEDRVLLNEGPEPGVGPRFTKMDAWIKGDSNADENEIDFIDYDGDGDMDAFLANFSGTNYLYQSGLSQGHDGSLGMYHFTGSSVGGSLAPNPELPGSGGSTQPTLDGEAADLDGDGDDDLLLANDQGQPNKMLVNVLGVPDVHAPVLQRITSVPDQPGAGDVVVQVAVRDNHPYYIIAYHQAELVWSVDGGPETVVPMVSQSAQLFRGVIAGAPVGTVSYRVEVTDAAGNTGVSGTRAYLQGASSPFVDLGSALPGVFGDPALTASGLLAPGTLGTLTLQNAAHSAAAALFVSVSSTPVPFKSGVLLAFPSVVVLYLGTSSAGDIPLTFVWPGGLTAGTELWFQYAVADAVAVSGVSLSNALKGTTP